jgi:DNA-binding transcriptional LysR family regulator
MELRQLATFIMIAKTKKFNQAAELLSYAQSTITTHIQALEAELGVKLFERFGHHISLTREGKALLSYAEQIVTLVDEAKEIVSFSEIPKGTLIIGTGESLSTYRLPGVLQEYRCKYPQVEIILKFSNCSNLRDLIKMNEVDVGLLIDREITEPELSVDILSPEPMYFVAAPHHALAQRDKVIPQDLENECLIITEPGCSFRATIESILQEFNVKPRSILEASSIESIKQFVMHDFGITMLPRFTIKSEIASNRLVLLNWQGHVSDYVVQLVHHKNKYISPTLLSFLQTAKEKFSVR